MYCNYCGKELPDGAKFCGFCGKKLVDSEVEASGEEVPSTTTVPAPEADAPAAAEAEASSEEAALAPAASEPATTSAAETSAQTADAPAAVETSSLASAPSATPAPVIAPKNTKRVVAIACAAVIVLAIAIVATIFLMQAIAPKELPLNPKTVKDEALLETLQNEYDKDANGTLSAEELAAVQTLDLGGSGANEGTSDNENTADIYNFIYLFYNLRSINVKSPSVTTIDLSKNTNLREANFKDAQNIKEIKLPNIPYYDDIKLPDKEDLDIIFPSGSEYEVKYVPKKIEGTKTAYGNQESFTYEQDVESATKVNSVNQNKGQYFGPKKFNYDDSGKIASYEEDTYMGSYKVVLDYNDANQIVDETVSGGYSHSSVIEYNDAGNASRIWNDYSFEYDSNKITLTSDLEPEAVFGEWGHEGETPTKFCAPALSNGGIYVKHEYTQSGGVIVADNIKILNSNPEGKHETVIHDFDQMPVLEEDSVTYEYENSKLKTLSYASGFSQNYEYDSRSNLVRVTSIGSATLHYVQYINNCNIQYACVICKKKSEPLSFLTLSGITSPNTANMQIVARHIGVARNGASNWPLMQDFKGKFWWDEDGVITNQLETTAAKKQAATKGEGAQNESGAGNSAAQSNKNTEELSDEAKTAYNAILAEYAQCQGKKYDEIDSGAFPDVNLDAIQDFGSSSITYCLYDLNGDGSKELLIKCSSESSQYKFVTDAYTYVSGQAKRVLYSWARSSNILCKDGYLKYHGSSGASNFVNGIYKFEGEFDFSNLHKNARSIYPDPKTIMEVSMDGTGAQKAPYYFTDESGTKKQISDEEAKQKFSEMDANYPEMNATWIPITQSL